MKGRNGWAAIAAIMFASAALGCGSGDTQPLRSNPVTGVAGTAPATEGAAAAEGAAAGNSSADDFDNPAGPNTTPLAGTGTMPDYGKCENLQCQQHDCPNGGATTISGTVYDPAGNNPLYNVAVYVPNEPVAKLASGASCDSCDSLYTGRPIAATLTDSTGKFTLEDAPVGTDIPLVVQIGKWRRQFTVATVAMCQDNPQPNEMLRLPRNRSEGDIPNIAIATGSADTLECLLRRVGIDASEYVPGAGGEGRVHIFQGSPRTDVGGFFFGGPTEPEVAPNTSPAAPASPTALWSSLDSLMPYDIVLLSCEGQETAAMNQQALYDYANAGGRVFASHFHYAWFNTGPFGSENLATWTAGSNDIGDIAGTIVTTLANGDPFPKGQALFEWLEHVGALQNDTLPIEQARHNADVSAANPSSQPFILAGPGSPSPGATQYFSFNTPTSAANTPDAAHCGRVVYSDLHVGAASGDDPMQPVPNGCANRELSPQEAALEFMLFDLSSCLTPDERPPSPPTVD